MSSSYQFLALTFFDERLGVRGRCLLHLSDFGRPLRDHLLDELADAPLCTTSNTNKREEVRINKAKEYFVQ